MFKWLKVTFEPPRDIVNGWYWGLSAFTAIAGLGVVLAVFLTAIGVCGSIQNRTVIDGISSHPLTMQQQAALKILVDQKVLLSNDQALQISIAYFTNLMVIVLAVLGLTAVISYFGISRKLKTEADSVVEECVEKYVKQSVHFKQTVEDTVTEQLADRLDPIDDKLEEIERRLNVSGSVAKQAASPQPGGA